MKLTSATLNVLKNFATINQGIVVNKDKPVYTKTVSNTLLAKCVFSDLNETFAMYDISTYLQTLSLFDDPDIQFNDDNMLISDGIQKTIRHYSSIDVVDYPEDEQIESIESLTKDSITDFVLSGEQLSKILKASAVMRFDTLEFTSNGKTIEVKLSDSSNCTADTYEMDLGLCEREFEVKLFVDNVKVLPASYNVSVYDNLVCFKNETLSLTYWLAKAD